MPETAVARIDSPAETVPAITPMQMLQIAIEKGADLEQLQKLMDLQERWEANQARKAYTAAMTSFKLSPPTVIKNKHVGFGGTRGGGRTDYDHATLDQVVAVVAPALSKHGLSHGWTYTQEPAELAVTCVVTHKGGHSESVTLRGPHDNSGSKNPVQAICSTKTLLERYTLLGITGLAAADQDNDGDGDAAEPISDAQRDLVLKMIAETETDIQKFCAWLHIDAVAQMSIKDFRRAVEMLEKKQKKGAQT